MLINLSPFFLLCFFAFSAISVAYLTEKIMYHIPAIRNFIMGGEGDERK